MKNATLMGWNYCDNPGSWGPCRTGRRHTSMGTRLRAQLLHEHQCNLNYLTNVKVQDLGAVKSVEARAHCVNGQAFDVHSLKGSTKFKIEECGMSIC